MRFKEEASKFEAEIQSTDEVIKNYLISFEKLKSKYLKTY